MRVLVVEDESDTRQGLVDLLGTAAIEVRAVENGRLALAALREFRPDAIVLDLAMPDMGGDEFVEAIRGDAAASAIPIVVTSGWARRIAPPTPVAAWLPKPFEPRELLEVLHRLVPGPAPVPPGTA